MFSANFRETLQECCGINVFLSSQGCGQKVSQKVLDGLQSSGRRQLMTTVFIMLLSFHHCSWRFVGRRYRNFPELILVELTFTCASEPFAHGYPAERGSGGALWETPNRLSASVRLPKIPTFRQAKNIGGRPTLRGVRISGDSSSRNAVSFSSACTTKRFPSSRCSLRWRCSPAGINRSDVAQTPTTFLEITGDNFPIFQGERVARH